MKGIYWLIILQYSVLNINSLLVKHDKSGPTTTISPTEEPETNTKLPKQHHPNFMSPHGAFDYGPFGTHPMSHPSGQSNMMFQMPQMFNPADPDMFPMVPPPVAAEMMSQQLPSSQQMYPGQRPSSEMYPGQQPSSEMHPGQRPSSEMYPGQQPSSEMHPGQRPSSEMYPGQQPSSEMYPGQRPSTGMYPGQRPSSQMYPGQPSSPQMYPGQPSNMMQMMSPMDPRAFGPAADYPAILPVLTPDQHPLAPGMLLPNPSFLPLEFPMSTNPSSLVHPEAEPPEWVPSTWGGEVHPNTLLENFFPEMHPFSNPSLIQYPSHITPTPQHYYHPKGMPFIPQPNPQLPEGKGTSSKPSQNSAVAVAESRSQAEPFIGPLTSTGTTGSHHPANSAFFLPQPFSQKPYQVQGYELGATGSQPRSQAETLPGPFSEQPFPQQRGSILPQPFSHQPYQSKGAPHGGPNQGFSPFNFMPSFLHDPFLLPIPSTGELPRVQPGGHVPMDPAAEPGDFPSLMDFMQNENPFDMPPPPPFLNSHAPIFPVLPPFLEGLSAPSESGQSMPSKKWRYKNSGHLKWPSKYSYCSGNRQSPVDIDDSNIIYTPNLKQFTFTGFDGYNTAFTVKNNGHTASVRVSGNMSVGGGGFGDVYNTAEIHFHWGSNDRDGSEHAINGRKYPLEMHIVNYATKYGDLKNAMQYRDGLGVLGVLFDIGSENLAFAEIEKQLKKVQNPGTSAPLPRIDVSELLPVNAGDYFRYYGSLTTPPCYQSVLWTIFEQRQTISPSQLDSLRSMYETTKHIPVSPNTVIFGEAMSNNFRPLQPMFGRIINTNIKRYADPIYLAHQGMVNIPAVFRQSSPQFHPNKIPVKSTASATTTSKQMVNHISTSALPSQKAALNNVEPRVANISTVSSFRGTNGSVITVVDVPGNASKPAELIVVNTSGIVEQLNHPAAQPTPGIPTTLPVASHITTTNPPTTIRLKLDPIITSTTPAITTVTSVIPTLLPFTTSTKTPTSTTSQTTTILTTPTLLQPTSPTLPPTTSTIVPATSTSSSSSSSTPQTINSQLKEIVQKFPSQSQAEAPYPSLGLIISTLVPSTVDQLTSVMTQQPVFQVVNPVDLSTQIVSDPLFQSTTPLSPNQGQLSQRVVQEARKAAIEAAQQQLSMGSQQSPEFTQSVIAAATKAARAQIALLMAAQSTGQATTQQMSTAPQTLLLTSTVEPLKAQSLKSQVGHIDPSQPQTADQLAQHAVNQAFKDNIFQQLLTEQQAPQKAAQQHLKQKTAQQTVQQVVDQQQLRDQHAVNQAVQHNLTQQLLLEQQAPQKAAQQIQLAEQRAAQQTVQQVVDQQQLRDQQAVNQAFQQNLVQQAASQTQSSIQAVNTASQQASQQQQLAQHMANHAAQQQTNQNASNQQQHSQQLTNQALRQLLAQQLANQEQLANQQAADQAAQQQIAQQAANQAAQQQLANQQAANQAAKQQIAQQAANQAAQQQLANQQAANQAAQQQLANQQAANQAAQQQITQQAANQAAQQQIAQQATNQAAKQQIAQQAANQAAQQQIAQQTANQATQPQATQAQLIQQVLAQLRKQANFDKLTQQQIIKLVSNRVIQHQNLQKAASRVSQVQTNPLVPRQLRQQTPSLQTSRLPASTSTLTHSGNPQHQRPVKLSSPVSGITTNRQGTSTKTRNILIQPSAQGTPVVSVLRKAPQPVQTIKSNRGQNIHWAALQRARANAQAKAKSKSQALTAPKSVSVLVPRQKSVVATVRFASTSQKLHPVNVLPNQVRFKDSNAVKQETGIIPSVQSYPRPPASPTGSQSSLIAAYFRALSVSKPEVVPVLRRVRSQFGDKKLLNYLQKKFGRLRTV